MTRRTGVTVRALRYYESIGLVVPSRLPNGYRDYDPVSVRQIEAQVLDWLRAHPERRL